MMSTKFLKKVMLALALTLAVTLSTGLWDHTFGLSLTPSAYACGSGSGAGGGC